LIPPEDGARVVLDLAAGATSCESGAALLVDAGPTTEQL
jgi:hypothetical protein